MAEVAPAASGATPVEAGQWRSWGCAVWAVLRPHPRRKGFWICVSHVFPHDVITAGRRELEAMKLVDRDFFGKGRGHPGERFISALETAHCEREEPTGG